jgi:hypothetical protein
VAPIHLFTWNLGKESATTAHDLTVDHLALLGTKGLFIACITRASQRIPDREGTTHG